MLLRLLVFLVIAAVLLLFVHQVVLPAMRGRRLFPMLRTRKADALRGEVADLADAVEDMQELAVLTAQQRELEQKLGTHNNEEGK
jgi:hypothetical protein